MKKKVGKKMERNMGIGRRFLALSMCLCMLLSLMPTLSASAIDQANSQGISSTIVNAASTTLEDVSAALKETGFSGGTVLVYDDSFTINGKPAIKVTVGYYNTEPAAGFSLNLRLNRVKLGLVRPTNGSEFTSSTVVGTNAYFPVQFRTLESVLVNPSETVEDLESGEQVPLKDKTLMDDTYGLFSVPAGAGLTNYDSTTGILEIRPSKSIPVVSNYLKYTNVDRESQNITSYPVETGKDDKVWFTYDIYLMPIGEYTIEDIQSTDLELTPSETGNEELGTLVSDAGNYMNKNSALVNFPTPKAATYTKPIKVVHPQGAAPIPDVQVTVTDGGNNVVATETSNNEGAISVNLPQGTYSYTAKYKGTNENYKSTLAETTGTFEVSETIDGASNSEFTLTMELIVAGQENVSFKVVDGDNNNAVIQGASVTLGSGGNATKTTDAGGLAAFSPVAGDYTFQVTAPGYENLVRDTDASAKILTVASGGAVSATMAAYRDRVLYDESSKVTTIVLSKSKTQITLPIPVPENFDVSNAGDLRVTVSANPDGSTPATLALPIVLTTADNGFGEKLSYTPDTGAMASLQALVNLPQGNYLITVAGAGLEESETTLNVVPNTQDSSTTVNAGGTVNADNTISGGYTDKTADGAIDLGTSSGNAKKDSTVNSDGSYSGGSNAAGLLDSDIITPPAVISDPLYYVVGSLNSDATGMTVEVYLKNIDAFSGTFGLKYDTNVFSGLASTDGFVLNSSLKVEAIKLEGETVEAENPTAGTGFHAFSWETLSKETPFETTSGQKLVATYKLSVKSGVNLSTLMHNESLFVMPYPQTGAGKTIAAQQGSGAQAFLSEYWRETGFNAAKEGTLEASKATAGGFFQVFRSSSKNDYSTINYDARTQFLFEDYGNVAVHVKVESADGNPVTGGKVSFYPEDATSTEGTPIRTGVTGADGEAILSMPKNSKVTVGVTADGFLPFSTLDLGAAQQVESIGSEATLLGPYALTPQEGHPVVIAAESQNKVALSGNATAYNSVDYLFSLLPASGWQWKSGHPILDDLTITLQQLNADGTEASTGALVKTDDYIWNSKLNRYQINGSAITGIVPEGKHEAGKITIAVGTDALEEIGKTDPNATYKVTATAGKGGAVAHGENTGSGFDTTVEGTIVETLAAGKTDSAAYTFKPNDPTEEMTAAGSVYVIDRLLINGAQVELTETQRREGITHQFKDLTGDATITATFGILPKDGKIPEDITPESDPVVTFVVGEYGQATVTVSATADSPLVGSARKDYVTADGGLTALVEARQSVPQPDASTQNYVIDQVLVNGVPAESSVWTAAGEGALFGEAVKGTLTLSGLSAGGVTTVAITFKPAKTNEDDVVDPIQALVNTAIKGGKGTITPVGLEVYTVGNTPSYLVTPNANWSIDKVEVQVPGAAAANDAAQDLEDKTQSFLLTLDPLKAGTTDLGVAFSEVTYTVKMTVDLNDKNSEGTLSPKKTPVKVSFTRSSGDDPVTLTFEEKCPTNTGIFSFQAKVPQGSWDVLVQKNGYLNYEIKNFTIQEDGTVDGTYKSGEGNVIYFGVGSGETNPSEAKRIKPIVGDASWDGIMISPNDAAQVANGMVSGANADRVDRADYDEDGSVTTDKEMAYVKYNFGCRYISKTYAEFLAQ